MEKEIEIPEGYEARIEGNKVIIEPMESEDEKIRKLLVWQVHRNIEDETNDLAQSVYDGIKGHDPDLEESIEDWKRCLAYLEKQKEQKPNLELIKQSWYTEGYTDGKYKMEPMWNIKTGKGGPRYEKNEKYGQPLERKSAEWSDEDEGMLNCIIATLCEESHGGREANDKMVVWLENRLKILRPQPKQEWSEEDKEMIEDIIDLLDPNLAASDFHEIENWLKFLPKRFNLQPKQWTEEDEKMLKEIIHNVNGFDATTGNITQNFKQHEKKIIWLKALSLRKRLDDVDKLCSNEWSDGDEKMLNGIVERGNSEIPRGECGLTPNQVAWLETRLKSLRPQPKQEWSEEDKNIINEVASILINDENRADNKSEEYRLAYLAERIQSLLPQSHWKPSEEQMEVLLNTEGLVRANNYPENAKILASLYDDLKKL